MKKTLLYIEDEADDVFFMEEAIRRSDIPIDLRSVSDGKKSLAYLTGEPPYDDRAQYPLPAAILLDLNLPLMSGLEVLQAIRAQPRFRDLPVLMFSSSGYQKDRHQAQKLGATDYLLKPSSGLEFAAVARKIHAEWLNGVPAAEEVRSLRQTVLRAER